MSTINEFNCNSSCNVTGKTWLYSLGLQEYMHLFNDTSLEDLMELRESDLKEIGVRNGAHRARMASSLVLLRQMCTTGSKRKGNTSASNTPSNTPPCFLQHPDYSTPLCSPCIKPSHTPDLTADTGSTRTQHSDMDSNLWYHGDISRSTAEQLVLFGGEEHFLIRSSASQPGDLVLTVCFNHTALHFVINRAKVKRSLEKNNEEFETFYRFEDEMFGTVSELVLHYASIRKPVTVASGALIRFPVIRNGGLLQTEMQPEKSFNGRYSMQRASSSDQSKERELKNWKRSLSLPGNEMSMCLVEIPDDSGFSINGSTDNLFKGSDTIKQADSPKRINTVEGNKKLLKVTPALSVDMNTGPGTITQKTTKTFSPPVKPSRVPSILTRGTQRPNVLIRSTPQECNDTESICASYRMCNSIDGDNKTSAFSQHESALMKEVHLNGKDVENNSPLPARRMEHCLNVHVPKFPSLLDNIENYESILVTANSKPLEMTAIENVKALLLSRSAMVISQAITVVDVELLCINGCEMVGFGVMSGLELITLPQGQCLRQDVSERFYCLYLFVCTLILKCNSRDECVLMLKQWIDVAHLLHTSLGNLFAFAAVSSALLSPQIQRLHRAWIQLSREHNSSFIMLQSKISSLLTSLRDSSASMSLQDITVPFVLPVVSLLSDPIRSADAEASDDRKIDAIFDDVDNYSLDVMLSHLDSARTIAEQRFLYQATVNRLLGDVLEPMRAYVRSRRGEEVEQGEGRACDRQILDLACLQTQILLLFGGKSVRAEPVERYSKFMKVINALSEKMEPDM